jgi:hypothetical protein
VLRYLRVTRGPVSVRDRRLAGKPATHAAIDDVLGELRAFGIRAPNVSFVWSVDGSGVEDDAPSVIHLHRAMVKGDRAPARVLEASERLAAIDLRAAIRHELGHSLLFQDGRAAKTKRFKALFGDVATKYRVTTAVAEINRRLQQHGGLANPRYRGVVSLYGATHPHEKFAEAVRVALATAGDPAAIAAWGKRHGTNDQVAAQIAYAAEWLGAYSR